MSRLAHAIGFDDAPFAPTWRGDVPVVGTIYAGATLHGVVTGRVRRDGANATTTLSRLVTGSTFAASLQIILLQGVALAGFNVVDAHRLHAETGLPVLVVARRQSTGEAMRDALLTRIPGGARKWALVERLGPQEPINERAEGASAGPVGRQPGGVTVNERAEGASAGPVGRQPGGVTIWVQRVGLTLEEAAGAISRFTVTGNIPEPLRAAHLIAGALALGQSHGRV